METKACLCAHHVLEVLDKDNYVDWSVRIKTYLMAQDLWDTIETTIEPPKQENDEATFRAYSKKNFMALHVIQNSCRPDTFYEIRKISSAKIAWNTLAEKYKLSKNTNSVVRKVLNKHNYVNWSARVKTYLMAQDLWDTVEVTTDPPKQEDDEGAFKGWRKKDFMALHVIQNSCGPDTFSEIKDIGSAKTAWDTLARNYNVSKNTNSVVREILKEDNYVDWSARVKTYLMAEDLWDIVEATTDPPKQEDDEAAFKVWWNKDFMALQVIRNSCGPDTFSKIRESGSAKSAWDTLARKCNVSESTNSVVREVLDRNNYVDWSAQTKTYLMAQDLWGTIEGTTDPPKKEDDKASFKDWSKKDLMALHSIQDACGPDMFSKINEASSAKDAWDILAHTCSVTDNNGYDSYVKYVRSDDWNAAKEFLKCHPNAGSAEITDMGQTALHMAVATGNENTVEELVELMLEEHLEIQEDHGVTALNEAVVRGSYRMVECMVRKNRKLTRIKTSRGSIPVVTAIIYGQIRLARYLYRLTSMDDLHPKQDNNGATLFTNAIYNGALACYNTTEIALDLIHECPPLTFARDKENNSPLVALASMPHLFRRGYRLVFWKQWIYNCIHIQLARSIDEIRLNISRNDEVKPMGSGAPLFRRLVSNVRNFLGIDHLYEIKLIHVQSDELLRLMCEEMSKSNREKRSDGRVFYAIKLATQKGNFEFVSKMLESKPELVRNAYSKLRNLYMLAVLHRQAEIFSHLCTLDWKNSATSHKDEDINSILHLAGMSVDSTALDKIPGAALQMQRELQWFKEVESTIPRTVRETINKDGLTPRELFTRNHKDLMKEGEEWMKNTATSCTVVGALIVTIMFAAAFTIPVLMFLGILTSRYAEEDFLESLPRKMIIGLSTLFFSITTMMIAFSTAILIMLRGHSWIVIPAICLSCVPVTLFVFMQFRLLRDMFKSTYGSGIFTRKMKPLC